MMDILIVTATSLEIEPFKEKWKNVPLTGIQLQFLETGVGQVQSCYSLTRNILTSRPQFVVAAGIGGTFSREMPIGSVCQVRAEIFADLGVEESSGWMDLFDLKLDNPDKFPFSSGRLQNPSPPMSVAAIDAIGCSVNEVTTDPLRIESISRRYGPLVESMEGAAIHYVCLKEQVPFVHLRSVSNAVGERNKQRWDIKTAIEKLTASIYEVIQKLAIKE